MTPPLQSLQAIANTLTRGIIFDQEFSDEEDPIDCVLEPFVNWFSVGDTVVMEMDLESDKAVGKMYNLNDADNPEKHFITPLKTTNNAIGVTMNIMFKPSLTVLRQTIENETCHQPCKPASKSLD